MEADLWESFLRLGTRFGRFKTNGKNTVPEGKRWQF